MTAPRISRRCRRCEWTATYETHDQARAGALEHATNAQHPQCGICTRSLPLEDDEICTACIARTRQTLDQVLELYALLPAELGVLHGASLDGTPHGEDGHALPGGTPLVLLAGGSMGTAITSTAGGAHYPWGAPGRRRKSYHWSEPPRDTHGNPTGEGAWVEDDDDHWQSAAAEDQHPSDPPSVAYELAKWEDDLRHMLGAPAAEQQATVAGAAGYLGQRLTWMARNHPAFVDFAADLRKLRATLIDATSTGTRPERAEVACFDCGQDTLERRYLHPTPCPHSPPDFAPLSRGAARQLQLLWRHAHRCDQGGKADDWKCAACGRVYDQVSYYLARRVWLESQEPTEPVDAYYAAAYLTSRLGRQVKPATIRKWAERGKIDQVGMRKGRCVYDFAGLKAQADRMRA